jgi:hypothetical protein
MKVILFFSWTIPIYLYKIVKREHYALCKLQHDLTAAKSWCEHWNIRTNEAEVYVIIIPEDLESLRKY